MQGFIEKSLLKLTIPDKPKSSNQKYKTKIGYNNKTNNGDTV